MLAELANMADIHPLDAISWWPLAIEWWIIIVLTAIILGLLTIFLYKKMKYYRSWRYKSWKNLTQLQAQVGTVSNKQIIQQLSIELRKITLQLYPRSECASIWGSERLKWLQERDPKGFLWTSEATMLTTLPYSAADLKVHSNAVEKLIIAAKRWIK